MNERGFSKLACLAFVPGVGVSTFSEVRATLIAIALLFPLIAFAGYSVESRVAASARFQGQIRLAQVNRSRIVRMQIDEETGLRGFALDGDKIFLQPFNAALVAFPSESADLHDVLTQLDMPDSLAIVDAEQRINALWLQTIAQPVLRDRSQAVRLSLAGKKLIDNFRNRDQELSTMLSNAANDADAGLETALDRAFLVLGVSILIVAVGGLALAYILSREARRAFVNDVQYRNQKRIADSLQSAFLQKTLPATPGVGLHATYVPAMAEAQVGGDWYDAFALPDGRILFSIGDVAGHGIEAAVVMNRARQAIVAAALREDDPATVLSRANDAIMLQEGRMITAIFGFVDPGKLLISYATAGHPPPVIVRPGVEPKFLPHEGMPLGILPSVSYRTFEEKASSDALVAFYTDGVLEHKRDLFDGERRLLAATKSAIGRSDPALAIHESIFAGSPAADDVAIFTVSFRMGEDGATSSASVDALQSSRLNVTST